MDPPGRRPYPSVMAQITVGKRGARGIISFPLDASLAANAKRILDRMAPDMTMFSSEGLMFGTIYPGGVHGAIDDVRPLGGRILFVASCFAGYGIPGMPSIAQQFAQSLDVPTWGWIGGFDRVLSDPESTKVRLTYPNGATVDVPAIELFARMDGDQLRAGWLAGDLPPLA